MMYMGKTPSGPARLCILLAYRDDEASSRYFCCADDLRTTQHLQTVSIVWLVLQDLGPNRLSPPTSRPDFVDDRQNDIGQHKLHWVIPFHIQTQQTFHLSSNLSYMCEAQEGKARQRHHVIPLPLTVSNQQQVIDESIIKLRTKPSNLHHKMSHRTALNSYRDHPGSSGDMQPRLIQTT